MAQNSCPFSTNTPGNIRIPPVPVTTTQDVPNVPRPSGDITRTAYENRQTDPMGGTTPPDESTRRGRGWLANQVYQVRPPHPQNTLEPCTIAGKAPLMSADQSDHPFEKHNLLADPNTRRRRCYNIYDIGQGMVGRVCTAIGTDGVLDSRESYDGIGVNGNADWVRGNRFGWNYNGRMINDPINYTYKTPAMLKTNKQYYTPDPFYPTPDRCLGKNCWFKTYPHNKLYTEGGYPYWRYPYDTTQPGSRSPVYRLSELESNKRLKHLVEGFGMWGSKTPRKRGGCEAAFWLGAFVILASLMYQHRK